MDTISSTSDLLSDLLQVVGTLAFAVSGAMAASRNRLDWFGVLVVGAVTAVGGGTIRDILLDDLPPSWIIDAWPVWLALGVGAGVLLIVSQERFIAGRTRRSLDSLQVVLVADAAGLAIFTILGADKALDVEVGKGVAVLLGVTTGVGGGVLRDLLLAQKPIVLTGQFYATAAIIGSAIYVGVIALGVAPHIAFWLPVLLIFVLRLVALRRDWSLPTADVGTESD